MLMFPYDRAYFLIRRDVIWNCYRMLCLDTCHIGVDFGAIVQVVGDRSINLLKRHISELLPHALRAVSELIQLHDVF